jgi:Mg-chelatase subunit ChlD
MPNKKLINSLKTINNMNQKIYNLIILDASGSMYSIRNEAIAGVVETIQTIRVAQEENEEQEQLFSLVVFNGKRIATVYDRMPITKVSDFNEKDYQPTDNTPLYDAMGDSITNLQRYIDEEENALVTIITDGYENASREWNHQRVFQLVEDLKKKNWLFTYIGANQDALAVARDMGIDHSMNFTSDAKGTKAMFMKEKRSRKAFYDKLARGMSFKKAMAEEDFFVDDNEDA